MEMLDLKGRASMARVLDAVNGELEGATGFVAGYLESLSEDLALFAPPLVPVPAA